MKQNRDRKSAAFLFNLNNFLPFEAVLTSEDGHRGCHVVCRGCHDVLGGQVILKEQIIVKNEAKPRSKIGRVFV